MIAHSAVLFADFLYTMHAWLFGLIFFAVILAAGEAGFWLGRRSHVKGYEATIKRSSAVEAAVLGVLGLLLAFSLVMAVSRFDVRRQLVVDEANAIGTAYLRSQFVPPPEGPDLARLLREYVDAKIHFFDAGVDAGHLHASREHTDRLQNELWSRGIAYAQKDPRSVPAGLLLQSLNQTFDLGNSRWAALGLHVPDAVLWIDILIGLLSGLLVGYNFGVASHRHLISTGLLALCIATVLSVIVDLDQPQRGLIRVSNQPLIDLRHDLEEKY